MKYLPSGKKFKVYLLKIYYTPDCGSRLVVQENVADSFLGGNKIHDNISYNLQAKRWIDSAGPCLPKSQPNCPFLAHSSPGPSKNQAWWYICLLQVLYFVLVRKMVLMSECCMRSWLQILTVYVPESPKHKTWR